MCEQPTSGVRVKLYICRIICAQVSSFFSWSFVSIAVVSSVSSSRSSWSSYFLYDESQKKNLKVTKYAYRIITAYTLTKLFSCSEKSTYCALENEERISINFLNKLFRRPFSHANRNAPCRYQGTAQCLGELAFPSSCGVGIARVQLLIGR